MQKKDLKNQSDKNIQQIWSIRNFLNMIEGIYEKNTANIMLHKEKTAKFTCNFMNETRMPAFTTAI